MVRQRPAGFEPVDEVAQREVQQTLEQISSQEARAEALRQVGRKLLGVPGTPVEKAELARRICILLAERKLTQARAAAVLGIDQPKVSALIRGKLDGFSTDRFFRFLNALGHDVEILVRPRRENGRALTRVVNT